VAPGIDIDKDVLEQMDFAPIVDRSAVVEMDPKVFALGKTIL